MHFCFQFVEKKNVTEFEILAIYIDEFAQVERRRCVKVWIMQTIHIHIFNRFMFDDENAWEELYFSLSAGSSEFH